MDKHPKKRIEIIIETPLVDRIADILDRMDVSGYSVIPLAAGRGQGSAWSADGQVGSAMQITLIICISDGAIADRILDSVFGIVSQHTGFVTVSDVYVMRPDRF
jgi:hypothetical protein